MQTLAEADSPLDRLRRELESPPFHQWLRPEAVSADAGKGSVTVRLPIRREFWRASEDGIVHGGIIAALIDITGHAAVAIQVGSMVPTIDLRIDYLRAAGGSHLTAIARILRCGRTVARVDVDVSDAAEKLVAVGRGTFFLGSGAVCKP